jgi:hypothetical protein
MSWSFQPQMQRTLQPLEFAISLRASPPKPRQPSATSLERDTGLEPATFSLGKPREGVGGGSTALQVVRKTENHSEGDLQFASPGTRLGRILCLVCVWKIR